jgi:hypothetical protein
MILPLTSQGRAQAARAVAQLLKNPCVDEVWEFFAFMPEADKATLLAARPADVFVTAVRAYREAAPGRNLRAALLALQAGRVCPTIARAQAALKA